MRHPRRALVRGAIALIAVGALVLVTGAQAAPPRTRVLRGLSVVGGRSWTVIEVQLNGPYRYLTHLPAGVSDTLQIRIRPEPGSIELSDLQAGEVIEWRERDIVALLDVELAVDSAGNPQIVVHFSQPVEASVSQGDDLERLRIAVRPVRTEVEAATDTGPERPASEPGPDPPGEAESARAPDRVDEIMAEGRRALTAASHDRAILLFTKVLGDPTHPRAAEAQELLGLSHQRNGQLAHARAEYEEYLRVYPDSDGVPRVRQRLEAILTAKEGGRARAAPIQPRERSFSHDYVGSVAQYYRSNVLETDDLGTETTLSSLDSDVFLSSRHTRGQLAVRTNFAASYRRDLLDAGDTSDALRVTSAFTDASWGERGFSSRIGRQSATSGGGVIGRFDGVRLGSRLNKWLQLNVTSGFPVDFTESNRINTSRPFAGLSLDLGQFREAWDGQIFGVHQRIDGIEDRSAVGGQLRFVHPDGFAFGLVDYDVSYAALNTAMGIATWRPTSSTSLNAMVDIRRSPILTTFNALQGQLVDDIDELRDTFSESEIRDLADDRTATSRMFTFGASQQLGATWQVSGDVTLSNLSDTEASGGVPGMDGTGNEYFYSLRTTATDLLLRGSFTSFGLRYSDASTSKRYSANLAGRYPIVRSLRLGPQLIVELRSNELGSDQWVYRPSLRADYRWRRFVFQIEGGVIFENGTENDVNADESEYFFSLGYRYDF